jgi:hypothetical protein
MADAKTPQEKAYLFARDNERPANTHETATMRAANLNTFVPPAVPPAQMAKVYVASPGCGTRPVNGHAVRTARGKSTTPSSAGVVQNDPHSSMSRRRFWNRSPRA